MTLPYDVARCDGVRDELCERCARREPGDPIQQWAIAPAWDQGECVNFVEVERRKE